CGQIAQEPNRRPERANMSDVTRILDRVQQGDTKAAQELLPLVYEELRRLAAQKMGREAPGQTLQPTALVHEAWLRLGGEDQPAWQNRAHFLAAAADMNEWNFTSPVSKHPRTMRRCFKS